MDEGMDGQTVGREEGKEVNVRGFFKLKAAELNVSLLRSGTVGSHGSGRCSLVRSIESSSGSY